MRTITIKITDTNKGTANVKTEIKDTAKVTDVEKTTGNAVYHSLCEILKNMKEK